ncbi:Aminoglycoside phosphotransferase [Penicillium digitatum]|nr:Aminoglycoside phosphotransferase [Penicillium digitatum]
MFPKEKVRNEVAIIRYIHDQTSIPAPFVLDWGTRKDSPFELGQYMIMEFMDHHTNMYDVLNMLGRSRAYRGILDPDFDEDELEQLQIDDFTWKVTHRPLSMPMNELIRLGRYLNRAIVHPMNQRNDAIDSADDCRRKFVARYLFRKLTRERKLTERWAAFENGPFKFWCDDFRPGNVLLNKDFKIAAVVDWEFTCAAPVEFSYAPPWWLLIEKPEYWPTDGGLEDWCGEYECQLQTFLRAMISREDEAIRKCQLKENRRLSGPMRESWESGDFWVAYAARNNFAFDAIYWQKIDRRFFGPTRCSDPADAWRERPKYLNAEEKHDMEQVVSQQLENMKSRVLAWDPDEYTLGQIDIARKKAETEESEIKGTEIG